MASKKVASAYVDLQLSLASFKQATGEAQNLMKQFSTQTRAEMQQSRESVRLLSEELGLGIPRGLQGIISKLPGVTSAMNLAFDAVVVFALIDTIVKVTEKVTDFAKKSEDAAKKHTEAWAGVIGPINDTNDKLELTKTKLENAIAKLEHKPQNMLRQAIEEAKVAADELGKQLDADIKKVTDDFKGEEHNWASQLLLHQTGGTAAAGIAADTQFKFNQITAGTYQGPGRDETEQRDSIVRAAIIDAQARLGPAQGRLDELKRNGTPLDHSSSAQDVHTLTELIAALKGMLTTSSLTQGVAGLTGKKNTLEAKNDAAKDSTRADEAAKRLFDSVVKQIQERDAQINANSGAGPKQLEELKAKETEAIPAQMKAWIESETGKNKSFTPEQATRITNTLLPELVKTANDAKAAEDARTQAEISRASALESAHDVKTKELNNAIDNKGAEAMNSLYQEVTKAGEAFAKSVVAAQEAVGKEQLAEGKITGAQYQALRMSGLKAETDQALATNALTYNGDRQKATQNNYSEFLKANAEYTAYSLSIRGVPGEEGLRDTAHATLLEQLREINGNAKKEVEYLGVARDFKDREANQNLGTAQFESSLEAYKTTAIGGVDSVFDEFISRSQDLGKQIHDILTETINGVNDTLIKMMIEPPYKHRHAWKDMGKSLFTGVAKTGLEDAESQGMKMAENIPGLGGFLKQFDKHKPTGTAGDLLHVSVDKTVQAAMPAITGMAGSDMQTQSLDLGGIASTAMGLLPMMAGGGVLSSGDMAIVGEQGPELLQVGSTSKINNSRDTAGMFSSGGGSVTHQISIDARGANDPAAVNAAVHRAMAGYIPHMQNYAVASIRDNKNRTPGRRG